MSRHIEFLEHLKKIGADIEEKNITEKLFQLGLNSSDHIESFLDQLKDKGFIKWEDKRPLIPYENDPYSSVVFLGSAPDDKAPLKYTAKILLAGAEHLDERAIKVGQNKWLVVSIVVAILAVIIGAYSAYLTRVNNEKDIEIRTLKQEMSNSSKASNQQIEKLNLELAETQKALQSLRAQRAKESATAAPNSRKSNDQNRSKSPISNSDQRRRNGRPHA